MKEKVEKVLNEVNGYAIGVKDDLESFRLKFLAKKGEITALFDEFKNVPKEDRKLFGQELNKLKNLAQNKYNEFKDKMESADTGESEDFDFTLPPVPETLGAIHPLTLVRNRIVEIFDKIGFNLSEGPEIETDWNNFTALNFPENHPAREMQDTFFIEKNPDVVLRTHTSSVQARVMQNGTPPFRTLSPGRVFRNEAISARAHCIFHQIEGLYVAEKVSFKDLKDTLLYFVREFFGPDTNIRLRPSYFPFTEPSAELDVSCNICKGKGCNICKYTGWLEIGGCGMVDPNVLENCGIDSEKYSGFAFGVGVERIAMLKYQIKDLRLFTENDIRFLKQFRSTM